jgi:hypothetical protein
MSIAMREPEPAPPKRRRGRPRARLLPVGPPDDVVFADWRRTTAALHDLSRLRQRHHARMNRARKLSTKGVTAAYAVRSVTWRQQAETTETGHRLSRAELFADFFDDQHVTPQEMAARLIHKELHDALVAIEGETATAVARTRAARATANLKRLPSWRTFYNKLRAR